MLETFEPMRARREELAARPDDVEDVLRAGVVSSVRGPGGGYRLARGAGDTRISDIILAVDEPLKATRCSEAKGCLADGRRCLTHDLWTELSHEIDSFLGGITLASLVRNRGVRSIASRQDSQLIEARLI